MSAGDLGASLVGESTTGRPAHWRPGGCPSLPSRSPLPAANAAEAARRARRPPGCGHAGCPVQPSISSPRPASRVLPERPEARRGAPRRRKPQGTPVRNDEQEMLPDFLPRQHGGLPV